MSISLLTDDQVIKQIAEKLADYKHVPAMGMCSQHVKKWITQFHESDRRFILDETIRLLDIGYLSEDNYKHILKAIAESRANVPFFRESCFLNIQKQGSSQSELIKSLSDLVSVKFNVVTRESEREYVRKFKSFVYIDDVSFSGNKAITDLAWLIDSYDLSNINVSVYFFASHTYADYHIKNRIESIFSNRNINVVIKTGSMRNVENRVSYSSSSGVFWPRDYSVNIPSEFADSEIYTGTLRTGYSQNKNFQDESTRDCLEAILTKVGFDILLKSKSPSDVLKPLGFSTFKGVGFGGTTFTYRNCPNNTPLAFWWGDYELTGTSALDCWYPLMKRIVYNQ